MKLNLLWIQQKYNKQLNKPKLQHSQLNLPLQLLPNQLNLLLLPQKFSQEIFNNQHRPTQWLKY
jgi:hypothetical protein